MTSDSWENFSAFATYLRSEHRRLQACLKNAERLWQEHRSKEDDSGLIAGLQHLRGELAHHLSEEETGGCLEEAVIHDPHLSRKASELEHEDPELLAILDRLISRLQTAPDAAEAIESDYRLLARRICEHVAAESRIVQESFGMEVD